jgi:hypothetical protein
MNVVKRQIGTISTTVQCLQQQLLSKPVYLKGKSSMANSELTLPRGRITSDKLNYINSGTIALLRILFSIMDNINKAFYLNKLESRTNQ